MTELVQFHQKGGLWFALLGVHVVALASDSGEWLSFLDGDVTWRRRRADVAAAKAAISEHIRQWYDAAHQPLVAGQAERLCKVPAARTREVVRINTIDVEAIALRLKRDGVVSTYVMPPVTPGEPPAVATLAQARMYCVSAAETADLKSRAQPDDALSAHERVVFAALVRLIDGCTSSDIIKGELKRIARARADAERAAESTRVEGESDRAASAEGATA
jgi:hypothetical protein